MPFLHCRPPYWQGEDFVPCIRKDLFQVYLPWTFVGVSASILFWDLSRKAIKIRESKRFRQIPSSLPPQSAARGSGESEEDEEDDEFAQHLSLRHTVSKDSEIDVIVKRPREEVVLAVLEELAVMGLVGIHITALVTLGYNDNHHELSIFWTGLASWLYVLILATIRLMLPKSRYATYILWDHTAILYMLNFVLSAITFRTALIHQTSKVARVLSISDFSLVSLLCIIVLTSRRGNTTVVLESDNGLEPSREPLASLFSELTFNWVDPIVWKGYWKSLELSDVWDLCYGDHALQVLGAFRQAKKTTSLAYKLVKHFQRDLLIQAVWAAIGSTFSFAPTLLIRVILEYVQQPEDTPKNVAWLFVVLLFVTATMCSIAGGQAYFIGRRICIQLRVIIIGEVYRKALRRKAGAAPENILGEEAKEKEKGNAKGKTDKREIIGQVNTGAIINLMAIDSFKVSEICAYLHYLVAAVPVQVVIAVALLYQILGWSSVVGIGAMILLLPINYWLSDQFSKVQKVIMATTDKRINSTSEIMQNIRIIKFFAWESRFEQTVDKSRRAELKALRNRFILWSLASTLWCASPVFITYFSFLVYTTIEKKPLHAPIAFTALSLFNILRVPLDQLADMITNVLQAKVSVDRVDEFLNEEETEKYHLLQPHYDSGDDSENHPLVGFKGAAFTWGKRSGDGKAVGNKDYQAFTLTDLDLEFRIGKLNIIAGPTGSGKTSLLMALLGEMTHLKGRVYLPGANSREELIPDPMTKLTESVAYCAQQAWLVNDTIKNNILFASPYNEQRYRDVIVACSLERDLEILDAGDETEVGEKGITLSGGQKQRISLARALYSNSAYLLLDDCLSAVDAHTAKWIFEYCIMGPLMKYRTCILVTHNTALCVPRAAKVVVMDHGRVKIQGKPETVIASGALGDTEIFKAALSNPATRLHSRMPSRVPSIAGSMNSLDTVHEVMNGHQLDLSGKNAVGDNTKPSKINTKKSMDESKSEGGVGWRVYGLYLRSMGSWYFWILATAAFVLQQLGSIASSVWVRQWALQYEVDETQNASFWHTYVYAADYSMSRDCHSSGTCVVAVPVSPPSRRLTTFGEYPKVNVTYYLTVYAAIGVAYVVSSLLREGVVFAGSLRASRLIHQQLLHSVMRARFRFFDLTPLGRIINRFSKDLEAIDQEVAAVALGMLNSLGSVIAVVILITAVTPGFIVAAIFICCIYCLIGIFYLRASRDLKRIEAVQRSPLYQHFGETLAGVATIRAYGDERRFVRDNLAKIDAHNRPYFYLWACNRWLGFRIDLAGATVSFFAGAFVILSTGRIDAGLAGLSLTYAITFTDNILWVVRLYAFNEQNMNSVERIKEYLEVEQEAPAIIPENRPPSSWPENGAVSFTSYTTRYRRDLEPVLRNLTFDIQPTEKVGIVGRTGAGKSSLALAILRCLEPETGTIYVDGIDISKIGLQDLREKITMVPQDPTLFTGTVRNNLDPFGLYTDEAIFNVLRRVQLITDEPRQTAPIADCSKSISKNIFRDLSSPIAESGSNLSQGQKQLLCLARALLKAPRIILFDEATASIDYATDAKIQDTIRRLESTTITIAHRLNTIIFYDKVLVLDAGKVVEYAHPWELIQIRDGMFRAMCEQSGEFEVLEAAARKAYEMKD